MISDLRENMERSSEGPIAIAVDSDKKNCEALKWAVEQYIPRGGMIKLVHVIQRSNGTSSNTEEESSERYQLDKRSNQFLSLRCLCTRRSIQSEVVLLEDQDVSKALIEYISQNCISTFLLSASLKKSITRLFKVDDIPTNVMRWAPDFCTVLVISKGRLSSVRSATRPLPQVFPSGTAPLSPLSNTTNDEAPSEMLLSREDDVFLEDFSSLDTDDSTVNMSGRISTDSSVLSFYEKLGTPRMLEIPRYSSQDDEKSNSSIYLDSPSDEKIASSLPAVEDDDAEAEKERLKKELKQMMNMYQAARKEALMEKEKALELEIWKNKAEKRLQAAEEATTTAIMKMEKMALDVQQRAEKAAIERGTDDTKKKVSDKHESLLHILLVLFLFYFYFTLR